MGLFQLLCCLTCSLILASTGPNSHSVLYSKTVDDVRLSIPGFNEKDSKDHHLTSFVAECIMPTDQGLFKMRSYVYSSKSQDLEPIVMISGNVKGKKDVLIRVHDQCFTSEVFGSMRCDCRSQLKESLRLIQENDGIVIYLQQEGRGIGISNKIAAYALQDRGMDTIDANIHLGFEGELREYHVVPDILKDLGIQSVRLLTNNPYKMEQLNQLGVVITERVPIQVAANPYNEGYLRSKRDKMRHLLSDDLSRSSNDINDIRWTNSANSVDAPITRPIDVLRQKQADFVSIDNYVRKQLKPLKSSAMKLRAGNNANIGTSSSTNSVGSSNMNSIDKNFVSSDGDISYAFGKDTVEAAIRAIHDGKIVLVVDDENRENEGDFIMAAEKATAETIGFIIRYSSGVLCVSLDGKRLDALRLPPMVINNEDPKQTAYSISVDYKYNTTTGISAADRALTFQRLVDPTANPADFHRPGHVFPLRYKPGGVRARKGHTEASLDLSVLAGLSAGGVLAEVVHDDGSMMRLPDLRIFAKKHGLVLTSVQDIVAYRVELETTK